AVEVLDDETAAVELRPDVVRDRRLARARETREPEGESSASVGLRLGALVGVDVLAHVVLSRFVFSWMPHSSLSQTAQRPLSSSSGGVGRVRGMHPIVRYPASCSGFEGISFTWMYDHPRFSSQSASGWILKTW